MLWNAKEETIPWKDDSYLKVFILSLMNKYFRNFKRVHLKVPTLLPNP